MIVSVTGGTGFIGSQIVDRLLEAGHEVRVLVRKTSNLRWLKDKDVKLVEGDIRDIESLREFLGNADQIYHVAGVVKARDRKGYFEGNVTATGNMLEAAADVAPNLSRFLYMSSLTAAGPSLSLDRPVREDDPCAPITTYGESKVAAESLVRTWSDKLPCTIVRPPAVFGPRDTEIFIYFQTIARGLNSIIGFNEKHLSLIHSSDLVNGTILAANAPGSIGETYFISSDEFYTWPQVGKTTASIMKRKHLTLRLPHSLVYILAAVAQGIAAIQKKPATLNLEKARDMTTQYWTCDISKAKNDLGYQPRLSLEDGIRNTVEWYYSQGWIKDRR